MKKQGDELDQTKLELRESKIKMAKSEEKFRLIAENTSDGIFISDKYGKLVYSSPSYHKLIGYTEEECLTHDVDFIYQVVHPDEKDELIALIFKTIEDQKDEIILTYRAQHKNGHYIWREDHAKFVYDEKGRLEKSYVICRDITERVEREEIYRLLTENSTDVIWLMGLDFKFKYLSPSTEKLFGYTLEERKILNFSQMYPESDLKFLQKLIAEKVEHYKKTGENDEQIFDLEGIHKDGHHINIEVSAKFVLGPQGKITGVQGISRNITSRKKAEKELIKAKEIAEENEARFKALHNASFGGITIHDKGIILDCNMGLSEITGYPVEELIGIDGLLLIAEKSREMVMQNILAEYEQAYEAIGLRKNGEEYPLRLEARMIPYKGKKVRVVEFRDITEQKKIEKELIQAKEKAEESDRLKSSFLANMSHEIRTPMNGILGFTSLLSDPDISEKEQKEFIQIITKAGNNLLGTVNDLIDISKIETGQMQLNITRINIKEKLEEMYVFFHNEALQKNNKIHYNCSLEKDELYIESDYIKLKSILSNLIKNSIKFTTDGEINVSCRKLKETIEFQVRDTGEGIPFDRQQAIFNRFEQAYYKSKYAIEGSGLGLAISKAYVELLGGKIWLESQENVGSTFYFTIPC